LAQLAPTTSSFLHLLFVPSDPIGNQAVLDNRAALAVILAQELGHSLVSHGSTKSVEALIVVTECEFGISIGDE
jgi:hypothetical protein